VFRKPDGEPYAAKRLSCVDKSAFKAACLKAGLKGVTQKSLQYTWVARQLAKGRTVRELQKLMGCPDRRMIVRIERDCRAEIGELTKYYCWLAHAISPTHNSDAGELTR
jgi:hypothetical protein